MNIRQQSYKKNRLEGYSAYVAAIKAGYSKNTAKNANKYMEKYGMAEWLEAQGLTDKALSEKINAGLNACKDPAGMVPDWPSRHKYTETILRLMGKLKDTPLIDNSKHMHTTYNLEGKSAGDIIGFINNRLAQRITK